jgi:PKD repeat protein
MMINHRSLLPIGILLFAASLFSSSFSIFSGLTATTLSPSFPWNSALAQAGGNDTQDDDSQLPGQDGEPPTDGEPTTQPPTNDTGGVEPEPLTAIARWDSTNGDTAPATFRFEADATGGTEPYTYGWDFGDGQQATGRTVSHTYENPGTYNATLTVTDAIGQTASDTTQATVQPPPTNDTDCQFEITTDEETYEPEDTVTINVTNNGNESLEFPNSILGLVIENLDTGEVFPLASAEVITTLEPAESNTFEFTYEELVNEIGTGTIEARVSTTGGCSDSTTFTLTDDTNGEPPTPGGNRSETSNRISVQIQQPGCTSISDAEHWNKIVFRITADPTGRIDSSLINTELEVLERVNDGAVLNLKDIVRYSIVNEPGILPQLTFEEADRLEIQILDVEYALICFT